MRDGRHQLVTNHKYNKHRHSFRSTKGIAKWFFVFEICLGSESEVWFLVNFKIQISRPKKIISAEIIWIFKKKSMFDQPNVKPLRRVMKLHIEKRRSFLLIISFAHSFGPLISMKKSNHNISSAKMPCLQYIAFFRAYLQCVSYWNGRN